MAKTIEQKVLELIAEQLSKPVASVNANQHIVDDLKADSLDVVEMLIKLENEFGVVVSDDEAKEMKTIGDLIKFVEKNI